jgi:hypothetical protein
MYNNAFQVIVKILVTKVSKKENFFHREIIMKEVFIFLAQ